MRALAACFAALAIPISAERVYEVTGTVEPQAPAAMTLHHVQSPFAVSAMTDLGGRFRFQRVPAGAYTLSAFVPGRAEGRITIEVGPGTADERGRVVVNLRMEESRQALEGGARVSARQLSIPGKAWKEYERAEKKIAKNDFAGAVAHLERATEIAPRFAAAWNHLGTIAYQTREYPTAEQRFRQALEADGEAYEPLVNLGGVLLNLGKFDEAWKYNFFAVAKRPQDALAQSQLGLTYFAQGKLELAEKHLSESVRLDPAHFSHPQLTLAEIYLRRGDRPRATGQLEDFLRLHPDWPGASRLRERIAELK